MTVEIFMIWLIIWVVFLVMSIIEQRGITFGFFAGLWVILFGVYIYLDGIALETGLQISYSGGSQIVERVYENSVPSFSTYGLLIGVPFVLIGLYICYLAANKNK